MTNPKKDWKEWKDPFLERDKKKKKLERERSFLNGNAFLSVPVPTNSGQRTSLPERRLGPILEGAHFFLGGGHLLRVEVVHLTFYLVYSFLRHRLASTTGINVPPHTQGHAPPWHGLGLAKGC